MVVMSRLIYLPTSSRMLDFAKGFGYLDSLILNESKFLHRYGDWVQSQGFPERSYSGRPISSITH